MEFPCEYTIKVLGRESPDFADWVVTVVQLHCGTCSEADARPSRGGNFLAVNVSFTAESLDQLHAVHAELQASDRVTLIL